MLIIRLPFIKLQTVKDISTHFLSGRANAGARRFRRSRETTREKPVLAGSFSHEASGRPSLIRHDGYAESGAPGRFGVSNSPKNLPVAP